MRVPITLTRSFDGSHIDTYTADNTTWLLVAHDVLTWLEVEVLPFWEIGTIRLSWPDDTDPLVSAALYGIGMSFRLIDRNA